MSVRFICPTDPPRSLILWKRLVCLHEKCVLRHSSLSGIKAADVCFLRDLRQCSVELPPSNTSAACIAFTIGESYPWGSIFDLMHKSSATSQQVFSPTFALHAINDIVNGLSFLHAGRFSNYCRYFLWLIVSMVLVKKVNFVDL